MEEVSVRVNGLAICSRCQDVYKKDSRCGICMRGTTPEISTMKDGLRALEEMTALGEAEEIKREILRIGSLMEWCLEQMRMPPPVVSRPVATPSSGSEGEELWVL